MLTGNYLIAGGSGLMGNTALRRLVRQEEVKHLACTIHKNLPNIQYPGVSYSPGDLTDLDVCYKAVEDIDYVFMFAGILSTSPVLAKDPIRHINQNLRMNANMLEASYFSGVKKFVWLGSTTGYRQTPHTLCEEEMNVGDPPDNYFSVGHMSRYTETMCRAYATKMPKKMTTIVLRPSTIYGEYETFDTDKSHVLPAMVRKVVERQNPIEIWGNPNNTRDFIYCDDVFDACLLAMDKVEDFDVFNIGSGRKVSLKELVCLIADLDGYVNFELKASSHKPTAISGREINLYKLGEVLGFKRKTLLAVGVEKVIKKYRTLMESFNVA